MADAIRFILVRPSHPGNIGAAARAMKNMGFHRLVVVSDTPPDLAAAEIMATNARDLLHTAQICETLDDALDGVVWAVATTGRPRVWKYPVLSSRTLGAELLPRTGAGDVAILFGQEDFGLDNAALSRCQAVCEIPTEGMKSLNLAQAVLVIAYELMNAAQGPIEAPAVDAVDLTALEPVVEQWVEAWQAVGFLKGRNPAQFEATLRQFLGRATLDSRELNLMLGFFNKLRHYLVRTGGLQASPSPRGSDPAE